MRRTGQFHMMYKIAHKLRFATFNIVLVTLFVSQIQTDAQCKNHCETNSDSFNIGFEIGFKQKSTKSANRNTDLHCHHSNQQKPETKSKKNPNQSSNDSALPTSNTDVNYHNEQTAEREHGLLNGSLKSVNCNEQAYNSFLYPNVTNKINFNDYLLQPRTLYKIQYDLYPFVKSNSAYLELGKVNNSYLNIIPAAYKPSSTKLALVQVFII